MGNFLVGVFNHVEIQYTKREKEDKVEVNMEDKEKFMKLALKEGEKALAIGEVPIGAVLVHEGKVLARGHNTKEKNRSALEHAEINVIRKASKKLGQWRLTECELYVTIEPCAMCAGALVQSRVGKVYIGSMDPKAGACGSVMNLLQEDKFNHKISIESGLLEKESRALMTDFFNQLRKRKK